jgi:hypothetical protein
LQGHQGACVSRGNHLADQAAKRAAEELSSPEVPKQTVKLLLAPELPPTPNYTKEEEQWAKDEKGIEEKGGWWKLPYQRLFVPSAVAVALVKQQHGLMHLGKMALEKLLDRYYFIPKLPTLCAQVSARCITCARNNVSQGPRPSPGIQTTGTMPFEDLEVDITEVKPCQGYQYLLVLVCTYSEWVEAYPPTHTQKKHER